MYFLISFTIMLIPQQKIQTNWSYWKQCQCKMRTVRNMNNTDDVPTWSHNLKQIMHQNVNGPWRGMEGKKDPPWQFASVKMDDVWNGLRTISLGCQFPHGVVLRAIVDEFIGTGVGAKNYFSSEFIAWRIYIWLLDKGFVIQRDYI